MRILLVAPWFPHPANNGAKLRIFHLLRALATRHRVTLVAFSCTGEPPPPDIGPLQQWCERVHLQAGRVYQARQLSAIAGLLSPTPRSLASTWDPGLARLVARLSSAKPFDLAIAAQIGAAPYVARARATCRVLEEVELTIPHDAVARAPHALARLRARLTLAKLRGYLRRAARRFDAFTTVSEPERALLGRWVDPRRVHVVPNGVDVAAAAPFVDTPRDRHLLVYPGALTYAPNHEAVHGFVRDVLPAVRREVPAARLVVTGRHTGVDTTSLSADAGVTLTGHVPDVRPIVAGARACVVPLRTGGGTRLKVLEAMALGTPVVSTRKGVEGLDLAHDVHCLIADRPADLARAVVGVLTDDTLWHRLRRVALDHVQRRYDWARIGTVYVNWLESVAPQDAPHACPASPAAAAAAAMEAI